MHRKFIALIVSTAICITSLSAMPARADDNDTARALAGFAALAILGLAIHRARDKDDAPTVSHVAPPPINHSVRPRPLPQRAARYNLPGKCLRNHKLHGGPSRLLGLQCLQSNYRYTAQLPQACRLRFDGGNFSRTGYEPLCLRERGYRIVNK
ncbi:hypothetical protein [Sedimentitalea todarodis]|uniref:Secreted protein n=1 Tax=Sedimentitalea todarodis TaxID=1631240 RepID=A0ABU3VGB2_9RHOB|nr:hypothetical protein [Sedimentitalea todarodis]MDU9005128.1 hypothetical protein [Sedimentitalea todarodis]